MSTAALLEPDKDARLGSETRRDHHDDSLGEREEPLREPLCELLCEREEALCEREEALLAALLDSRGRVITRTELARAAGLRRAPRRVDVHLVNVRRHLHGGLDYRLVNVRGRGWMLAATS